MKKFLIAQLSLSIYIFGLNSMQESDLDSYSDLNSSNEQDQFRPDNQFLEDLEKIVKSKDVFTASKLFINYRASKLFRSHFEPDSEQYIELYDYLTDNFVKLLIDKIVSKKLKEFPKNNAIRLLFNRKLESKETEPPIIDDEEDESDSYYTLMITIIDQILNSVSPITAFDLENKLNENLSLTVSRAIEYINSTIDIENDQDFFLNYLKQVLIKKFLHEVALTSFLNDSLPLVLLLLESNEIDINYSFKRFGCPDPISYLILAIQTFNNILKNKKNTSFIKSIIAIMIQNDACNLQVTPTESILTYAILNSTPNLAIFLLNNGLDIRNCRDEIKPLALAELLRRPRLKNILEQNGDRATKEELDHAREFLNRIQFNNSKLDECEPSRCVVC